MMWRKSVFLILFSLLTQKAALDCETMKETNKFASPNLTSEAKVVMKGQNVSITCSHRNKSLQITYFLFRNTNCMGTQASRGEPVTFHISISKAGDVGPYKCKAQVCNATSYSPEFNFTPFNPVTTPVLTIARQTNHYVTLHCMSANGSLPIDYTFFEKDTPMLPVITKHAREPAELNLTRLAGGGEQYKCEAANGRPDHVQYSHPVTPPTRGDSCPLCLQLLLPVLLLLLIVTILILAFWMLPKYKARKAMQDKAPGVYENTPMGVGLYANVCENQADKEAVPGLEPRQCVSTAQDKTKHVEEIHYATPMFQEVMTPQNHEACNAGKPEYVYSEIIL